MSRTFCPAASVWCATATAALRRRAPGCSSVARPAAAPAGLVQALGAGGAGGGIAAFARRLWTGGSAGTRFRGNAAVLTAGARPGLSPATPAARRLPRPVSTATPVVRGYKTPKNLKKIKHTYNPPTTALKKKYKMKTKKAVSSRFKRI